MTKPPPSPARTAKRSPKGQEALTAALENLASRLDPETRERLRKGGPAARWRRRKDDRPAIFYFHPWEIDPDQPRVSNAPLKSRVRHYTNLGKMERKLFRLFRSHAWDRTDRVAAREQARLA